nr:MAG TPA: hypothetical protein [Caudoviricetes sp.]
MFACFLSNKRAKEGCTLKKCGRKVRCFRSI